MTEESCDILILGAGMAGLTAARALAERGLRVIVLEARDRVGGRLLTHIIHGAVAELGAEFIHGRVPELWALIDEAGLHVTEREGSMLSLDYGSTTLTVDDSRSADLFAPLEALEDYEGPDEPFADWLASSDGTEDDRAALTGYVEGFNAADARVIGIHSLGAQQKAEDETEGDRSWHLNGGYAQLADFLASKVREAGGRILFGREVAELVWEPGHVDVTTATGELYEAARCLVTLPLGVLQRTNHGGPIIEPEPQPIVAARRLAMGHVARFTLVFRTRWWQQAEVGLAPETLAGMSFVFTPEHMPPVWWSGSAAEGDTAAVLTGWVGGPRCESLAQCNADELADLACAALATIFHFDEEQIRGELLSVETHEWTRDPYSRGAYSYLPAGALDAPQAMTVPVESTLYFAGEHTDITGHWGTVHAAIRSGIRAAAQITG